MACAHNEWIGSIALKILCNELPTTEPEHLMKIERKIREAYAECEARGPDLDG